MLFKPVDNKENKIIIITHLTSYTTQGHTKDKIKSHRLRIDTKPWPCIMLTTLKSLVQTNNLRRQTRNIKQTRGRESKTRPSKLATKGSWARYRIGIPEIRDLLLFRWELGTG